MCISLGGIALAKINTGEIVVCSWYFSKGLFLNKVNFPLSPGPDRRIEFLKKIKEKVSFNISHLYYVFPTHFSPHLLASTACVWLLKLLGCTMSCPLHFSTGEE